MKSVFVMAFSMQCHHCINFMGKDRMLSSSNTQVNEGVRYNSEFIRNALTLGRKKQYLTAVSVVFRGIKVDSNSEIAEFTVFDMVGESTVISTIHRLVDGNNYFIERIFDDYNPGKPTFKMHVGGSKEFYAAVNSTIAKINWRKMVKGFPNFLLVDCEEWHKSIKSASSPPHYIPKSVNLFKQTFDDGTSTMALDAKVEHRNIFVGINSYIEFEDFNR